MDIATVPSGSTSVPTEVPAWELAGAAWGHAAADWAYLFEPHARDAIEDIFAALDVQAGTDLLDIACGSGFALGRAERIGASTSGIDASSDLVEIARRRAPASDLLAGDMYQLPWADDRFDVVTSFNGIWGGCTDALVEARRVLRADGLIGLTFWGPGDALDLRDWFIALGTSTPSVGEEMISLAHIGVPGVVEEMLDDAGFTDVVRFAAPAILEFANADIAWSALRSPGVVVPALEAVGERTLRERFLAAIEPFRSGDGSYRFVNELTCVTARCA